MLERERAQCGDKAAQMLCKCCCSKKKDWIAIVCECPHASSTNNHRPVVRTGIVALADNHTKKAPLFVRSLFELAAVGKPERTERYRKRRSEDSTGGVEHMQVA